MTESEFVPKAAREEQLAAVAAAAETTKEAVNFSDAYSRLDPEKLDQDELDRLPTPSGWRVLVLPYAGKKTTDGGIYIPEAVQEQNSRTTVVGYVVALGSEAYADKAKFSSGPWCKKGDFVLVRPNAGTRVIIHGREFRIINDDSVEAVVDEPRGIRRK